MFAGFLALVLLQGQTAVQPHTGLTLNASVSFAPGNYTCPSPADDKPAVTIQGDGITIDFANATLLGTPIEVDPDARKGYGVEVKGKNVTIKNLKARGYMVGLIARDCPGLKLVNCDFSYNWKPRLLSTIEREDGADWMSFHQNEKDEWLRYGAGVYLRDCDKFQITGLRVVGGANGLMLTGCDEGKLWNSNLSFLSAIGLGMYRSSDNKILHNNIDWCVRGYSHGRWNRGQDSAGILIYEQSHRNTFAYNSVTHGGDGFFLWAGQTTMDTGEGGCNDNVLYGNDFSHAPTNGIEATFSRNKFSNNKVLECWHGIWGGYSWDSWVVGNVFGLNGQAIAWEHGQANMVASNIFNEDTEGISLWQNKTQDPNWGYAKAKNTESRDWMIRNNWFNRIAGPAIRVRDSKNVGIGADNAFWSNGSTIATEGVNPRLDIVNNEFRVAKNDVPKTERAKGNLANRISIKPEYVPPKPWLRPDGNNIESGNWDAAPYLAKFDVEWNPWLKGGPGGRKAVKIKDLAYNESESLTDAPAPLSDGKDPFLKKGSLRGRRYILVDDWGPYDFKSPLLWVREEAGGSMKLEVLGPKGTWKVASTSPGVEVTPTSGNTGDFVTVKGATGNVSVQLEYVGVETTDYRGIVTPAGTPIKFGFKRFFAPIDWTVKFYEWKESGDPSEPHATPKEDLLQAILKGAPLKEFKTDRLDYASGGAFYQDGPSNRFATVAVGEFTVEPGEYVIDVTTDDGIRVWLDGKPILESWKYQGPTPYKAEVKLGGKHQLRVEHFEIDGYAALKVGIRPK